MLAISGGLDSMVLLDAVARSLSTPRSTVLVATFDHRTGNHASRAARLVERRAEKLGFKCVVGVALARGTRESEWREERWKFLRATARQFRAPVFTAHTLDDQIETVFMRILRDAGPRGLAGLYADSEILRPFLDITRKAVAEYARQNSIPFIEDPTNLDRRHLRNRIRHDLLPSIVRRNPHFPVELLRMARSAAQWRRSMEDLASNVHAEPEQNGALRIDRSELAGFDAESLRVLWPALAARASVVMDRRGTHRAAEFTIRGSTGGTIQLSCGVEILMRRDHLLLRRWRNDERGLRA